MLKHTTIGLACVLGAALAFAQTIVDLKLEPAQATVGQTVKATVRLNAPDNGYNCGIRFYWGDGQTIDVKVLDASQNPLVLTHVYHRPGQYNLMAEGKKVTSHLKCLGANARANLGVRPVMAVAPAVASAAGPLPSAKPQAMTQPECPAGWKLQTRSINRKTGAYTCMAKPGTALPASRLSCTGDSGYFENPKKGLLGCKP